MERNPYRPPQAPVADSSRQVSRAVVALATVLLGIVPATFELLATALQYWSLSAGVPEGIVVVVHWLQVVELLLVVTGTLAGYVALFFAARARVSVMRPVDESTQ